MTKTNGEHTETCGRCGYPKAEHYAVFSAAGEPPDVLFLCPTAVFLKDELHALMDDKP
jgi:hypothetical protein